MWAVPHAERLVSGGCAAEARFSLSSVPLLSYPQEEQS